VKSRWSDAEAAGLDPLALRVYTSRLIGAEPSLVLPGGGNTSVKLDGHDHRGRQCRTLAIKGSGSDLRTVDARGFATLVLDDLLALRERPEMPDEAMVEYLTRSLTDSRAPRPSIETLLHAFLPPAWVDHSHADAILALTNQPESTPVLRRAFGDAVAIVPYLQPGFALARAVLAAYRARPSVIGIVLDKHGLVTFGDSARASYERHVELVTIAEAALPAPVAVAEGDRIDAAIEARAAQLGPVLRGLVSRPVRAIVRFDGSARVRRFVDRPDVGVIAQQGPATPDHVLRTKRLPLVLSSQRPEAIAPQIAAYVAAYRAYVRARQPAGAREHDPHPRVVLAPQLGMFTMGKSAAEADLVAEIYRHTMDVIEAASAIGAYAALSADHLYNMEYWPLELYKLTLVPPERALARRVALVTGAGSGIGRAIALRLAAEGALVFATDLDGQRATATCAAIVAAGGEGASLGMDVADERGVTDAFEAVARSAGGVDIVVSNAGIADSAPLHQTPLAMWERNLRINATGHFLVCGAAVRQLRRQGLGGSIVLVGTKNVFDPGTDFGAYSAAKAAELQLARVLAIENGAEGIRVNVVNPDAVFGDSGLWTDELRRRRAAAHGLPASDLEDFYVQRTLLKARVTAADVAEAVLFFASDRSAKTTGAVLPVDGGVRGAFPR